MSLTMLLMRIMKVIMACDYRICGPSLALNPCKKYQIIYASVHSYFCTFMRNEYPSMILLPSNKYPVSDTISFNLLVFLYAGHQSSLKSIC